MSYSSLPTGRATQNGVLTILRESVIPDDAAEMPPIHDTAASARYLLTATHDEEWDALPHWDAAELAHGRRVLERLSRSGQEHVTPDPVPTQETCENAPHTCERFFDCCSCGGVECGCPYCWDCNACETCNPADPTESA